MVSLAARRAVWILITCSTIAFGVVACSDEDKKQVARFNVAGARKGIEADLRSAYPDVVVSPVDCPKRVVRRVGRTFLCTTKLSGAPLGLQVTIGRNREYTFETFSIVVTKAVAEQAVATRVTLPPTAIDCGPDAVHLGAVGTGFPCTVALSDGTKLNVVVRIVDAAGRLTVETA